MRLGDAGLHAPRLASPHPEIISDFSNNDEDFAMIFAPQEIHDYFFLCSVLPSFYLGRFPEVLCPISVALSPALFPPSLALIRAFSLFSGALTHTRSLLSGTLSLELLSSFSFSLIRGLSLPPSLPLPQTCWPKLL